MIIPVIIAGGKGQRLWPCSTDARPKPFISLAGETTTLFQNTVERLAYLPACEAPIIVCHAEQEMLAREQAEASGAPPDIAYLLEPSSRNTSAAICSAALAVEKRYSRNAIMLVLPADHIIRNPVAFAAALNSGAELAAKNKLITFAVKPSRPATGYGYLKIGPAINANAQQFQLDGFIEKPNRRKAEILSTSGEYAWNSGMFMFTAKTLLEHFDALEPEILRCCRNASPDHAIGQVIRLKSDEYEAVPAISIDCAIMERADNIAAVFTDFGWNEVGDWESVWHAHDKDEAGIASGGNVHCHHCQNCIIKSDGPYLTCERLRDMIAVCSQSALLIAPLGRAQEVKDAAQMIMKSNLKSHLSFTIKPDETRDFHDFSLNSLHLFGAATWHGSKLMIALTGDGTLRFRNIGADALHIVRILVA